VRRPRFHLPTLAAALAVLVATAGAAASLLQEKKGGGVKPAAPQQLVLRNATARSLAITWRRPADARSLAGYGLYENGARVGSTSAASHRFAGLRCDTRYVLGVDAGDTAGNRSARTTLKASTGACPLLVTPNGSDFELCTSSEPCQSFDRAYHVAEPGQTIEIAGGTYPSQTIGVDPSKVRARADVVFEPAPGAIVNIAGNLAMYGSHAVFRGSPSPYNFRLRKLASEAVAGASTSNHVTFENLDGETFNIGPNHEITIKGGDWGPSVACHARGSQFARSSWCPAGSPYAETGNEGGAGDYENRIAPDGTIPNQWPHDIVLDGLYIHDQNSLDLDGLHQGGLFLVSGHDIAIRNSRFVRNAVYQIQVQDFSTPACCGMTFGPIRDVVIENNWFGVPVRGLNDPGGDRVDDHQPELQLDPRNGACWRNWLVRFNSFHNGPALGFDGPPCFSNFRMVGNIGSDPGLQCFPSAPGLTWAYNAWLDGKCGPTDVVLRSLP
jgi:hypothetical protein